MDKSSKLASKTNPDRQYHDDSAMETDKNRKREEDRKAEKKQKSKRTDTMS